MGGFAAIRLDAISQLRRVEAPADELSQLKRGTRRQIWQGQGCRQEGHRQGAIFRDRLLKRRPAWVAFLSF